MVLLGQGNRHSKPHCCFQQSLSHAHHATLCLCFQVHGHHMLLFTGENGLTSNGLVAVSTDLLVSIINAYGTHLRLIVLNGCKTLHAAQAILRQCPTVDACICWSTSVHSEAAAIFVSALADTLASEGFPTVPVDRATVTRAFCAAQTAVLEQVRLSHLRGIGPVGVPLYSFLDPEDEAVTYQECPCATHCNTCR